MVHGGIAHLTSGQVAPAEAASAPPTPAIARSTIWNDELLVNKVTRAQTTCGMRS